jgi:rod shape-determining protein MreC
MRRNSRMTLLFVTLIICACMIFTSIVGVLAPAESIFALPLNLATGVFNDLSLKMSQLADDLTAIEALRERNRQLEAAWSAAQAELVELREIESDYNRLVGLLSYDASSRNQVVVAADVIQSFDPSAALRTIVLNRGARDGFAPGMAVVTENGLVGRIINVTATASRVLLVTDPNSTISARLQESRAPGGVVGLLTGGLRMQFIPLDAEISEGELVVTSGQGGNLPPDITIGVVTSLRQFEFELNQEAEVRSLIDFARLETVLVITSFEPIDLSAFEPNQEG